MISGTISKIVFAELVSSEPLYQKKTVIRTIQSMKIINNLRIIINFFSTFIGFTKNLLMLRGFSHIVYTFSHGKNR